MTRRRLTREESRARTREQLLTAAAELFAERGVGRTSVEQISDRAGYSRGAFYGNFEDKDVLVAELLRQRALAERDEVAAIAATSSTRDDAVQKMHSWHRHRDEHATGWLALRLELILHILRNPAAAHALAAREHEARRVWTDVVHRESTQSGVELPAAPALLATILHALDDGIAIQRAITPDDVPPEAVVDATALLLRTWAHGRTDTDEQGQL